MTASTPASPSCKVFSLGRSSGKSARLPTTRGQAPDTKSSCWTRPRPSNLPRGMCTLGAMNRSYHPRAEVLAICRLEHGIRTDIDIVGMRRDSQVANMAALAGETKKHLLDLGVGKVDGVPERNGIVQAEDAVPVREGSKTSSRVLINEGACQAGKNQARKRDPAQGAPRYFCTEGETQRCHEQGRHQEGQAKSDPLDQFMMRDCS
jgi:hypothetical protein